MCVYIYLSPQILGYSYYQKMALDCLPLEWTVFSDSLLVNKIWHS